METKSAPNLPIDEDDRDGDGNGDRKRRRKRDSHESMAKQRPNITGICQSFKVLIYVSIRDCEYFFGHRLK